MKKVRLLKLELTNYRNIENAVMVFDGSNAKIIGENRIGKTNSLEAIYFLLSNYLLDGSSELANLKPLYDTSKEVRVEGTFDVFDDATPQVPPREIRLAKTYGEKWVKQRGTDELTMQGHYEEYFVNGIKQSKERDYYELLKEYFGVRNDEKGDVDNIQMLINPLYLGNLGDSKDWTKLRTFIVKLIGDVSDEEVFEKAHQTIVIKQDLINALGKTDQLKKMYSNDIDTLETQLVGFDSQVELLEKTNKPTDEEVEEAKTKVEAINEKIDEMKNDSGKDAVADQIEKEIIEVSKKIIEMNSKEFEDFLNQPTDEKENKQKIAELNNQINNKVNELAQNVIAKNNASNKITMLKASREELLEQYHKYDEQIKNVDKQVVKECPTCHRPFEADEIEKRKKELVEGWEKHKTSIVEDGKKLKEEIDKHVSQYNDFARAEERLNGELAVLRDEFSKLNAQTYEKPIFKESDELVALRSKEKELKDQLSARKEKMSEKSSTDYEAVEKLESERLEAQKVIDDRNYYDRQMGLLDNVKAERKNVSNKLIDTEQKREALKTYIYTKLRLLDEHIAKVFGKIKFQLIKENINGGFDPVCKPYIYDIDKEKSTDVLWKSGSKSEKIITGIAITEAIRKELGLTELPFLFDEGGEISSDTLKTKFKTNAQLICVRVEDNINKPIVVKF